MGWSDEPNVIRLERDRTETTHEMGGKLMLAKKHTPDKVITKLAEGDRILN